MILKSPRSLILSKSRSYVTKIWFDDDDDNNDDDEKCDDDYVTMTTTINESNQDHWY